MSTGKSRAWRGMLATFLLLGLLAGCSREAVPSGQEAAEQTSSSETQSATSFVTEQVLESDEGTIHYSYYLPEAYDPNGRYPLMVTMPGYDMMWFGEDSSGENVDWRGFRTWTEQSEPMIVVSAQLEDWGETSARQAIALTEYFISHFAVDTDRIYAAGYSAGGETMSQAVAMRPDLYAAYLHAASQWDGDYSPVAENEVAIYIYMAEGDEYYGPARAREAFDNLRAAYEARDYSAEEIDEHLRLTLPDAAYFAERGITGNYHGAANIVFDDQQVISWILAQHKS